MQVGVQHLAKQLKMIPCLLNLGLNRLVPVKDKVAFFPRFSQNNSHILICTLKELLVAVIALPVK